MKFSEKWLREWVDPDISTEALVECLTMAGLEVAGVEPVAGEIEGLVVGEVVSVERHPDADNLHVCLVDSGKGDKHQVVCGAPNVRVGMKAPFAPIGASTVDTRIEKVKLRGIESFGMLCSERELGLSDHHAGLMALPDDAPVGQDVREYLRLDDVVFDLDLTPNRSDCLSIAGLARETGVLNGVNVQEVALQEVEPQTVDTFPVVLEASKACPRYVGRVIRDIDMTARTPLWMKERLRRSDIRSIDPIVDVTNYVMLELGQPLHAFDLDKLLGQIVVRLSTAGDRLTLLDGQDIDLLEDTLLITDGSGPVAIAGIMGGLTTAVTAGTTSIFLESAFFAPEALAGKARSYAHNTDASHRFERGVDFELQVRAMERATELLLKIAGGQPGPCVETVSEEDLPTANEVILRSQRIHRLLGIEVSAADVDDMLTRLGFEHTNLPEADDLGTRWLVRAPSHRFDIGIEADLIEEISRIYGYNNLPVRVPRADLVMPHVEETALDLMLLRNQLVSRGYQEAITYSFVDDVTQAALDPENHPIGLANPLSEDLSVMRTSLWPGLVKSLIYNKNRQQTRIRLFECGLRFIQPPNTETVDLAQIQQNPSLAGVVYGEKEPEGWANPSQAIDFYDIKGDLESLFELTKDAASFKFQKGSHPALHPGQTAQIVRNGQKIGLLGHLNPKLMRQFDIQGAVFLFELDLNAITRGKLPNYDDLSKFPAIRRDLAVIVGEEVSADAVQAVIRENAGEWLQNLKLFDLYHGKGIDPNRKSLALGLTFQHPSRTLRDEEINEFIDKIVVSLKRRFQAVLRN